ncbi:uncharacterized protein L969DRAFT_92330 [Mixia osmundae IAM 14324]|uniref:Uncharacterized protein n=1 Tax=Mixia osmundae (strain CBS 9802 / IAM 14324 / JCM 22182 / KY 12970) TaxID=764103 RepID=G7DTA3_MIXOS|nr:uncharacterized protein L969DRAFT_92330 [Mixia osmundae IAM 14324]KEI42912.1 hypothetical protein L969DRAFT_92330 [Mixia osmundae IAM 14324]GAA93750.1 hypothetical protein E5Q_00396 [Mixia osmundae IAM 14324]
MSLRPGYHSIVSSVHSAIGTTSRGCCEWGRYHRRQDPLFELSSRSASVGSNERDTTGAGIVPSTPDVATTPAKTAAAMMPGRPAAPSSTKLRTKMRVVKQDFRLLTPVFHDRRYVSSSQHVAGSRPCAVCWPPARFTRLVKTAFYEHAASGSQVTLARVLSDPREMRDWQIRHIAPPQGELLVNGVLTHSELNTTYNMAMLRLPEGCAWYAIGVARLPSVLDEETRIVGRPASLQRLGAFAIFRDAKTKEFSISGPTFVLPLDQTMVHPVCSDNPYGAEDPRLSWDDARRPQLIYGRAPSDETLCRDIGLVRDLRSLWPGLAEILTSPAIDHTAPVELVLPQQNVREKNWQLLPTFAANGLPMVSYSLSPRAVLKPVNLTSVSMLFEKLDAGSDCVGQAFSSQLGYRDEIHHATQISRLTLCHRGGCEPSSSNTVLVALGHIQHRGFLTYSQFVYLLNATRPHNVLSWGPTRKVTGYTDNFAYASSLIFEPKDASWADQYHDLLTPGHGFLDDSVVITYNLQDRAMAYIETTAQDLLASVSDCNA